MKFRLAAASLGKVPQGGFPFALKRVIVQADILEGTVFHPEYPGNHADPDKAKPLVQMPGMEIILHHGVELQDVKAQLFCLCKAVQNQLFADVPAPAPGIHGIARIGVTAQAPDAVRMQDIQPDDGSVFLPSFLPKSRCSGRGSSQGTAFLRRLSHTKRVIVIAFASRSWYSIGNHEGESKMENRVIIPAGYRPLLDEYDTQRAIAFIKETFQEEFSEALNLKRVSAPLFVTEESGLNDNLNGYERPVTFDIPAVGEAAQVVHSLAKWKRLALKRYHFSVGNGLYTDMNAIRRDEALDNLHSIYVDQWDWEKVITAENRNPDYLKLIVRSIVRAICNTNDRLQARYPQLRTVLSRETAFITTQELEDRYPALTPHERENAFVREHPTACLMQIGGKLRSGRPHDGRAPDYDDWTLNCDLLFWDEVLGRALEISSMGIRVDPAALDRQLRESGCDDRRNLPFHRMLLAGELPLTIGGGIGQSRLSMLMMGCAHIGEVQCGIWDRETVETCERAGIRLL